MDKSKDIVIRFLSDTRHFETGSKKVESSLFNLGDISFKSAAKMALGFFTVQKAIELVKQALIGTITASMDYENVVTNMTVLLGGNAEAANWLTNELEKLANRTPLKFQDLAFVGQTLLAAKVPFDTIIDKVRQLGDVAQFSKIGIGGVADLFAKAKGLGKVQGEIFEQLSTAQLIPVMDEMAKIMGTNVAGLREMGAKGKVSFDILDQAIVNTTSKGGKYFQGMEKGAKTMGGLWSSALDQISAIGKEFTGVKDSMKGGEVGEDTLWGMMKNVLQSIMDTVTAIMPVLGPALKFLGSTIGAVLKAIWDIFKVSSVFLVPTFTVFAMAIGAALYPIKLIAQFISWIINSMIDFVANLSWVKNFISDIKIIFVLVKLWIESVLNSIKITLNSIKQDFKDFFSDLFTFGDYDVKGMEKRKVEFEAKIRNQPQRAIGPVSQFGGGVITNNKAITYSNADNSYRVMNISFPTKAAAQEYVRTGKMSGRP